MSEVGPLERRLLWLALASKLLFWGTVCATLIAGIWDAAAGRRVGPPMGMIGAIALLAALQLCTWSAWALVRRGRIKGSGS